MLHRLSEVLERVATIRARLSELSDAAQSSAGFGDVLAQAQARSSADVAAQSVDELVRRAAARYGVDVDLIHAVIRAESDYDPHCLSSAGAIGLMQLMPATARSLGLTDAWDPAQNIDGGTKYLRQQLERFGDLRLALAAYNAGPGAVLRYGGVPPYPETRNYVQRVLAYLAQRQSAR